MPLDKFHVLTFIPVFHIVVAFHPTLRRWVFVELNGLAFGIGVAVNHFNRVPAHFTVFTHKMFGHPSHWLLR